MDSLSQAVETALGATDSSADRPESPVGDDRRQQQAAVKPKKRIDHHLWGTYLLLVMIALIELFSASVQEIRADDIFSPLIRHGRFIVAGLAVMLALQYIHYRFIFKFIPLYVIFSVGMMVAVRGGGEDINGAVRSITIMGTPVLPSEFMKLAVALGMAYILAKTPDTRQARCFVARIVDMPRLLARVRRAAVLAGSVKYDYHRCHRHGNDVCRRHGLEEIRHRRRHRVHPRAVRLQV